MTLITNAPRLPGDQLAAPIVRVELLDDAREPVVGYVAGTAQAVQHRLQFAANGMHDLSPALSEWGLELEPNAQIEPAGTVYRITEQVSRGRAAVHIIEVPETGGPYTVLQTLIDEPGSLGSLLLTHLDDEFDAHDASAVSVAPIDGMAAEDVQAALAELAAQDATEATDRAAANALLATSSALATETAARAAADTTLATDLAAETTARTTADALLATTAALTTEATARAAADTTLTTNLGAETTARVTADTTIATSVTTEATARAAADATLTTNLTAEAATRAAADTAATVALVAHAAVTTGVHGIANTAALVLTGDARLSDTRTPTDASVTQAKVPAGALGIDRLAVDPRARATHTGDQLASTISDLTSAVRTNRLDQMAAPAAAVNLNGQRLTNGSLPSAATDVITKEYADALRAGLLLKADPVRVMLDANVNINAPGSALDSIAMSVDDRVLLTGQASANDNGIYLWKGAAVPMVRASDADTSAEMRSGTAVWVTAGTYEDERWALTTADPITLGVTNQTWTFDGGLAHVTAGAGLTKTGNRLDVGGGTGITVGADTVGITAGGVGTTEIADLGVTTGKLANLGVTTAKLADVGVTTGKIADLGVTNAKIAADAVTDDKVAAGAAIAQSKIAGLVGAYLPVANVGAATSTLAFSTKATADGNSRLRLFAGGDLEWHHQSSGALLNFLKMTTTGALAMKGLTLENHDAPTSAPELHFTGYAGRASDKKAWGLGIDIAQATDATTKQAPFRDVVLFKFATTGVIDAFYGKHRGGDLVPIFAFGNASCWETPTESYILTVNPTLNESTMGGLLILQPTANTTPAFAVQDDSGTRLFIIEGTGLLRGSHYLTGGAICIQADPVNEIPLTFSRSDGTSFFSLKYNSSLLALRSLSGGTTVWEAAYNGFNVHQPLTASSTASVTGLLTALAGMDVTSPLTIKDGALVPRLWTEGGPGSLYLRGAHIASSAAICIQANATSESPLAFCKSDSTAFFSLVYAGSAIRLRSVTSAADIWQAEANHFQVLQPFTATGTAEVDGTFSANGDAVLGGASSTLGAYGSIGVARQTGVPITAAGIHAALVALNLITA